MQLAQERGDQGCPAGLVAGSAAADGLGIEILVEEDEVFPMRILGVGSVPSMAGPGAVGVGAKEIRHAGGDLDGELL